MKLRILAAWVLPTVALFAAGAPPAERRVHYQITDTNKVPLYYATSIFRDGEAATSATCLIASAAGTMVRVDHDADFAHHRAITRYQLHGGKPATVTLTLPYQATTRAAAIAEYRAHPEWRHSDVPVTLEGNGHVVRMSEQEWNKADPQSTLRKQAKAAVDPDLIAALVQLRFVFAYPQLADACGTLDVVIGERCIGTTDMYIAEVPGDCAFDAKFGLPCSAEQQQRADAGKRNPKPNGKWY